MSKIYRDLLTRNSTLTPAGYRIARQDSQIKDARDFFVVDNSANKPSRTNDPKKIPTDSERFDQVKKEVQENYGEFLTAPELRQFETWIKANRIDFGWVENRRYPTSVMIDDAFSKTLTEKEKIAFNNIGVALIKSAQKENKSYKRTHMEFATKKFEAIFKTIESESPGSLSAADQAYFSKAIANGDLRFEFKVGRDLPFAYNYDDDFTRQTIQDGKKAPFNKLIEHIKKLAEQEEEKTKTPAAPKTNSPSKNVATV